MTQTVLLEYQQLDDSLMQNPRIEIKELMRLLVISDEEFQKFNPSQRSALVSEFSAPACEPNDATPPPKGQ